MLFINSYLHAATKTNTYLNNYMRRILFLSILSFLFVTFAFGQSKRSTVTGKIIDLDTKTPLIGAVVIKDTVTGAGVITDDKGQFILKNMLLGKDNKIFVEYVGYHNMEVVIKPTKTNFVLPSPITLASAMKMKEIVVYGTAPIAEVKGDTTQFNAGAYKTNPDASAGDLLAKMPGFKQSEDGSVSKEGETITKVLVDGKNYFRDDAAAALNSLPANIVESIQFIDDKTDEAKFTGYDDGERVKTINIVTKTKQKSAVMGEYYAGYGRGENSKNHYMGSANTNIFTKKDIITIGFGANNINMNPISQRGYYGGGSSSGISSQAGLRFNYDRQIKDGSFSATYIFRDSERKRESFTNRTYKTDESTMLKYDTTNTNNQIHRIFINYEQKLNANNKIFARPSFSFTTTETTSANIQENKYSDQQLNTVTTSKSISDKFSYRINPNVMWFHNFTPKQFLTTSFRASISDDDQTRFLENNIAKIKEDILVDSVSNQKIKDLIGSNNVNFGANYTLRFSKKHSMSVRYGMTYDWSTNDKKTYAWDNTTGTYKDINDDLSNTFERDYLTNRLTLGYSYNKDNIQNVHIGVGYRNSALQNEQTYPEVLQAQKYNFNSPDVFSMYRYKISKSKMFTMMINSTSQLPSLNQLQEVLDVTNPIDVRIGNSQLDQAYRTMFMLNYRTSNVKKSTSFSVYSRVVNTQNYFSQRTRTLKEDEVIGGILVQKGAKITTYDNMDGMWSWRMGSNYAMPFKAIKSSVNMGLNYSLSRYPSMQDGNKYFTLNNSVDYDLNIVSNITPDLDFTVGSNTMFTNAKSDISNSSNVVEQVVKVKLDWIFWKGFFVNVDYNYRYNYISNAPNIDRHQNILNAAIGKKFLDNKLEVRISGFDLLNQYRSIFTSTSEQYIQSVVSNNLTRYVAFSVKYKFSTLKAQGLRTQNNNNYRRGHGPRMMRF